MNVLRTAGARLASVALWPVILLCMATSGQPGTAQVAEAAVGGEHSVWTGVSFGAANPDFGGAPRMGALGGYADLRLTRRFSVEGRVKFVRFAGYYGLKESTYLVGPSYTALRYGAARLYARVLVGAGDIHYPFQIGTDSYLAYAPAGGLEYRLRSRIAVRGEYEYQFWPGAPGIAGEPSHGLTPHGFAAGVSYRLLSRGIRACAPAPKPCVRDAVALGRHRQDGTAFDGWFTRGTA